MGSSLSYAQPLVFGNPANKQTNRCLIYRICLLICGKTESTLLLALVTYLSIRFTTVIRMQTPGSTFLRRQPLSVCEAKLKSCVLITFPPSCFMLHAGISMWFPLQRDARYQNIICMHVTDHTLCLDAPAWSSPFTFQVEVSFFYFFFLFTDPINRLIPLQVVSTRVTQRVGTAFHWTVILQLPPSVRNTSTTTRHSMWVWTPQCVCS